MGTPNIKMSANDFEAWCEENAAVIETAKTKNQLAVDDLVIRDVMGSMKSGKTLDEAGDWALSGKRDWSNCGGVSLSRNAILKSLLSIGWRSLAARKKGG